MEPISSWKLTLLWILAWLIVPRPRSQWEDIPWGMFLLITSALLLGMGFWAIFLAIFVSAWVVGFLLE